MLPKQHKPSEAERRVVFLRRTGILPVWIFLQIESEIFKTKNLRNAEHFPPFGSLAKTFNTSADACFCAFSVAGGRPAQ